MLKKGKTLLALTVFLISSTMIFAVIPKNRIPVKDMGKRKAYAEGEVLVKFKAGVSLDTVKKFAAARGLELKKHYRLLSEKMGGQLVLLKSNLKLNALNLGNNLAADLRVAYAHPNYQRFLAATVPNDTRFSEVWGLHNTGQTGGTADADIDAPEAWDIGTGSRDVVVAVIDTGLDYNHPDLKHNCWKNPGEIAGNGIDDDNNGYVDDVYGIDPAGVDGSGSSDDTDPMDGYGHGTHCAGTIGARGNNSLGVVGVNWDVQIMGLKFFDDAGGNGYDAFSIECIQYAIYQKVHGQNVVAINASWGGYSAAGDPGPNEDALRDAIEVATNVGIVFCAAAGNGDGDADAEGDNNDTEIHHYPSDFTLPGIISVAATDHDDALGSFSNFGPTSVDMGAPGVAILSTVPGVYTPQSGDIFYDDVESGVGNWVTSGTRNTWAITEKEEGFQNASFPVPSPTHFWSDRPGAEYRANTNSYLTYNANIDLSGYAGQDLYFGFGSAAYIEDGYDHGYVEFSNNGGSNWTRVYDFTGHAHYWSSFSIVIPDAFKTSQFRMRFHFTSDGSVQYWGWLIDSIGIGTDLTYSYESWNGTSMATPHVAGAVAWLASVYPDETVAQRKQRLMYGGDAKAALSGTTVSGRRLNLLGAYNYSPASGPSITVTSPNGGESLMMGTSHGITWTTTGTVGNVAIQYSLDSGVNWTSIVANTANDGTYSWTVPTVTASSHCLVRIWENSDRDPADTSDLVFSIVASTTETVSTPSTPSGPTTGVEGAAYTYTTGGSTSSLGHSVQYRFDWGDGSMSTWLPVGTTSAAHTWSGGGTYNIRAMARCSVHYVQSDWSTAAALTLADSPTWAAFSRFGAYAGAGRPTLEWHTNTQVGVAGFNLWRRDPRTGEFSKVNEKLLPALPSAPGGGVYRYEDPGADLGRPLVYQLEEIDARGRSLMYGPFTVDFASPSPEDVNLRAVKLSGEVPTGVYGYQCFPRERSDFERRRILERAAEKQPAVPMGTTSGDRARITVKGKGLFYVPASRIAAALGITEYWAVNKIRKHKLHLTTRGKKVAWLAAPDNTGIYFYGWGRETVFSDKNVYYLENNPGLAMQTLAAGAPAGAGNQAFSEELHFEENHFPLLLAGMDPAGDVWFWDYVVAGGGTKSFAVHVPGATGGGNARLTVTLRGATDAAGSPDHHAVILVNGVEVGDTAWNGTEAQVFEARFDASHLRNGANTIEVSGKLDTGAAYSTFYVDSFDLAYSRFYQAENNALICRGNGDSVITVDGLSDAQVVVLDLVKPRKPVVLAGVTPDASGRIAFVADSGEHDYLVWGLGSALAPIAVEADTPATIKSRARAAEHIIIAPENFTRQARVLADFRGNSGIPSVVATLEDVYEVYNFGEPDPNAIREFVADIYARSGRLKYLVLAGKGTYDYNDYNGYGDNLVPVLLAATPNGLVAADGLFGDAVTGDGMPEVAVGRLPAVTQSELLAMVRKIKAYERGQGEWTNKALFVADNNDNGGDFTGGSDHLDSLATGMSTEKVYHGASAEDTRAAVMAAWNAGVGLVNYCGHGGIRNLAQESFFDVDNAAALNNGERLPLAVMLTCAAGRFELPGFTSLGEALMLNPDGGMIGGLMPSGAAMHSDSMLLGEYFYRGVYRSVEEYAGGALLWAEKKYLKKGGEPSLLAVYNWFGDPALKIK